MLPSSFFLCIKFKILCRIFFGNAYFNQICCFVLIYILEYSLLNRIPSMTSDNTNYINNPPYALIKDLKQILIPDKIYTTNCLNFIHINIRSLIKNREHLHRIICDLPIQPDVIFVTETKLNSKSNIKFTNINNYKFIHKNSLSCAGGVGIYLKEDLRFIIRQDI